MTVECAVVLSVGSVLLVYFATITVADMSATSLLRV